MREQKVSKKRRTNVMTMPIEVFLNEVCHIATLTCVVVRRLLNGFLCPCRYFTCLCVVYGRVCAFITQLVEDSMCK